MLDVDVTDTVLPIITRNYLKQVFCQINW